MGKRFEVARPDGRSDSEVLVNVIRNRSPGEVVTYEQLADELAKGTDHTYTRQAVQSVVARSERKIAVILSRALLNVRGSGYKLALAEEHQRIAGNKKDRSQKLLKRGLRTLQHVRWDEMDPNQRAAHEGQLMILSAVASAVDGLNARMARVEATLEAAKSPSH